MLHMATQTSEMTMPDPVCLVEEWILPRRSGIQTHGPKMTTHPGIGDIVIGAVAWGLPDSSNLTVVMPLYNMLLEVS